MELSEKRNIAGRMIRCIRKNSSLTLQELAKKSGLSFQHLSDVEKGAKSSNEETIQKIMKMLGKPFYPDETILDEVSLCFDTLLKAYVDGDHEQRREQMIKLSENERWEYSYAYPTVWLARFMASGLEVKDYDYQLCEEHCLMLFDVFNDLQKSVFLLIRGICLYCDFHRYQEAKKDFEQSISYAPDHVLSGFTYNQLGLMYEYEYDLVKAYDMQLRAKEIMSRNYCFNRVLFVENSIGRIMAQQKRYDEMKECLLNVVNKSKLLKNGEEICDTAYFNLAYYSLFARKYDDVLLYAQRLINQGKMVARCSYLLAWAYMEMKDLKTSMQYYQLLVTKNRHDQADVDAYEKCLKYIYTGKENSYYKTLQSFAKKSKERGVLQDCVHALEYLIEYCEKHNMYKEGFKYQRELLNIIEKNG